MDRKSILVTAIATIVITAAMTFFSVAFGGFASNAPGSHSQGLTVPIGIHLTTAAGAAFLGPFILFRRKGDTLHKILGRIWGGLMLVTAITSIFIRSPGAGIAGTGFSFIHFFTLWTLLTLPLGVWAVRRGNVRAHRGCMVGLYIGLLIAGGFTFLPGRILGNLAFG